jgi:hypothetical protein
MVSLNGDMPNNVWTHFEAQLIDSNFGKVGATFSQILQNVTALYIKGDMRNGDETTELDNVQVTAATGSSVPEPSTIFLFGIGIASLAGLRRLKQKP